MIGLETAVRIPYARPASTMLHLYEANASFDESSRRKHLHPEVTRGRVVEAIQGFGLFGFGI